MQGVILDTDAIAPQDLDLSPITGLLDDWTFYPSTQPHECLSRIRAADVVITNKIALNAASIAAAGNLKLIQVAATGANNIDLAAARRAGVAVSNVSGYSTMTVAQHTLMLILALATNLVNYREDVQRGVWANNHFFCLLHHPIIELAGKNLVIIGYGEIGQAVAKAAQGLGMNVLIAQSLRDNQGTAAPSSDKIPRQPLHELLALADVITLHCPLTPQTHHLIGAEQLSQMKPSALLINVSRGGLVDEEALLVALKSGQIAGAGVDVLTEEPPVSGNPLLSEQLPNLLITPHCAWGSREARQRLVDEMALNIQAFLSGTARNRLV